MAIKTKFKLTANMLAILICGVIVFTDVSAASFPSGDIGYFTSSNFASSPQYTYDVIHGGIGNPRNIDEFISAIKTRVDNSNIESGTEYGWSMNSYPKTGAVFIVQSMLGRNKGVSDGRNIDSNSQDFKDWESLVRSYDSQGLIRFNQNVGTSEKTSTHQARFKSTDYSYSNYDVATARLSGDVVGGYTTQFLNPNNKNEVVYEIRNACGNAQGNISTLPTNWSVSGESFVDNGGWKAGNGGTVVYEKGKKINFHHKMSASGGASGSLSKINADRYVGTSLQSTRNNSNGYVGHVNNGKASFTANQSDFFYVNSAATPTDKTIESQYAYTIGGVDEIGKYVCMSLSFEGKSKNDSSEGFTTPACVRIVNKGETSGSYGTSGSDTKCTANRSGGWVKVESYKEDTTIMTGSTNLTGYSSGYHNDGDVGTTYYWTTTFDKGKMNLINTTHSPPTMSGSYKITQADVGVAKIFGSSIFSGTAYDQDNKNPSTSSGSTGGVCVYTPYDYSIKGETKIDSTYGGNGQPVIPKEVGETYTPILTIINNGPTKTKNTAWQVSTFTLSENATIPGQTNSANSNPCAIYGGNNCQIVASGSGIVANPGTVKTWSASQNVPEVELGTKICWSISASPLSSTPEHGDDTGWYHAYPVCITVVKKPKMQVWGGNVWSSGGIRTSTTSVSGQTFGSWAEYDLISKGNILKMASASGYNNPNGVSVSANQIARLTPRSSNNAFGGYSNWAQLSSENQKHPMLLNFSTRFQQSQDAHKAWNPSLVSNNSQPTIFNITGDVDIGATDFGSGQSAILFASGTVTIKDNINMHINEAVNAINTPQFVIIAAGDIKIDNRVANVDAWLLTDNDLKTCNISRSGVNQSSCGNSLKINGPVIAKNIRSWRTAGSLPTRTESAETYNLRLDAYQWLYSQSGGHGKVFTDYSKELPARF